VLGLEHLPEWRHPLFAGEKLKAAITSVSWQLNLLPPQSRVLASCVCALSASIAFHPTIIGPSDIKSFKDHSVFSLGADLRTYGVRRAPVYRALYERAFTLACEARIHIDVSEDNAASCFFLDVLERRRTPPFGFAQPTDAKDHSQHCNHSAMGRRLCIAFTYSRRMSRGSGTTRSAHLERFYSK
jgi:hypothetical protein